MGRKKKEEKEKLKKQMKVGEEKKKEEKVEVEKEKKEEEEVRNVQSGGRRGRKIWIIKAPNPDYEGWTLGVKFHRGIAKVDKKKVRDELVNIGYIDITKKDETG